MPKISLIASSIRPHLYEAMFKSLEGTSVKFEIVFAGNKPMNFLNHINDRKIPSYFKYITTADIKPAQCYEVARRAATGELVLWMADDCEFPDDVLGKAYRFYKENCGYKDIVSIQSKEHYDKWYLCDFEAHHFDGVDKSTPKMAPLGLMNRKYMDELGGPDRRFICGQWDNELVMRLYNDGGNLFQFDGASIELDHKNKHDQAFGISAERPFGQGYAHDRRILEGAWMKDKEMLPGPPYQRFDDGFEPYEEKDLLTVSQSYTMPEFWKD